MVGKVSKINGKPLPNLDMLEELAKEEEELTKHQQTYSVLDIFTNGYLRKVTGLLAICW